MTVYPADRRHLDELTNAILRHTHDVVLLLDGDGRILSISDSVQATMGFDPQERLGSTIFEYLHPDDVPYAIGAISQARGSIDRFPPIQIRSRHADGHWLHLEVSATSYRNERGDGRIVAVMRDISDRDLLASRRQEFEALLIRLGVESAGAGAETFDGIVARALEGIAHILAPRSITLSHRAGGAWRLDHRWEADLRVGTDSPVSIEPPPGGLEFTQGSLRPDRPAQDAHLVLVAEDGRHLCRMEVVWDGPTRRWGDVHSPTMRAVLSILLACRRRIDHEIELSHRALHDPLTGLANRTRFIQDLDVVIANHQRGRSGGMMVAFCDLDGFKGVNDLHGHATGDELLCEIAERLRGVTRTNTTVGRLSGDEFALVCDQVRTPEAAYAVGRRVLDALARPVRLDGIELTVSGSVGVRWVSEHEPCPESGELLAQADAAMYRAKRAGRGRVEFAHGLSPTDPGRGTNPEVHPL